MVWGRNGGSSFGWSLLDAAGWPRLIFRLWDVWCFFLLYVIAGAAAFCPAGQNSRFSFSALQCSGKGGLLWERGTVHMLLSLWLSRSWKCATLNWLRSVGVVVVVFMLTQHSAQCTSPDKHPLGAGRLPTWSGGQLAPQWVSLWTTNAFQFHQAQSAFSSSKRHRQAPAAAGRGGEGSEADIWSCISDPDFSRVSSVPRTGHQSSSTASSCCLPQEMSRSEEGRKSSACSSSCRAAPCCLQL